MNKQIFIIGLLLSSSVLLPAQESGIARGEEVWTKAEKHRDSSEYMHAINLSKEALGIFLYHIGEEDSLISVIYNCIGDDHYELDSFHIALEFYQKSLEIRRCVLGEDHYRVGSIYWDLAWLYEKLDQDSLAIESF